MYYGLTSSVKRRLILELQESFSHHPIYSKIVPYIQNKYSFKERPQFGIVVKGVSGQKIQLSAQNFMGTVQSYVMLTYLETPAQPLEWVREDQGAIHLNNGVMPTLAGVYYLEVLTVPTNVSEAGTFVIDPLITVTDEPVLLFESGIEREAQLQGIPTRGTLRLWENHNHLLVEGTDYDVDYATGAVTFKVRFYPNSTVTAGYRYPAPSVGPVNFYWNQSDTKTLPGVVLAFGKRAKVGDKVAIVVYPDRVDTANAFGGKMDFAFDLDVISQDPYQMEEIADLTFMYLWNDKRPGLSTEGLELSDVSMGGEAEESYDETGDLFFYNVSMSVQIQSDWEVHVPLPLTISRASMTTNAALQTTDFERRTDAASNLHILSPHADLFLATAPVIVGRNNQYEKIG